MPRTTIGRVELGVVTLAGAWTLVHLILGAAGNTAEDYWGPALLVLFAVALILAFRRYTLARPAFRGIVGEEFPEPRISRFFLGSSSASTVWFVVRMNVGATWLLAGWEKITSPAWGTSGTALTGFVSGALAKSSGSSPAVQGWYVWFLQHIVLHATGLFSFVITFGEFAVGAGLLLGALTGIAAGFGVLMNMNYLLAGTVSINPVIGMFGLFLCFSWRVCGWIGLDHWLLPALGLPWKPGTFVRPAPKLTPTPTPTTI
jgi:thiosulfate dehydrogenase [quinone] large subunit